MQAREIRYRYAGKVRVLVPFPPWRLLLTTRGLDLSASGVSALLDPLTGVGENDDDRAALLVEGDDYDVQLESADPGTGLDVPTPMLTARLARREPTPAGIKLAFQFVRPTAELLAFVHDHQLPLGGRA